VQKKINQERIIHGQVIKDIQDMTWLSWTNTRNTSGTAGSFLKAYSDLGGVETYYKLSNYDAVHGIIGHECVNEIIVDRLLTILGVEHLSYRLIHANILIDDKPHETWLCSSTNFRRQEESKLALDAYYQAERLTGESPIDFCMRQGWSEYIWQMLAVDFIILNRDRHGANIEVLRDLKERTLRLAPLFDHGISLIFSCHNESAALAVDVMDDKQVQCFVGSRSAWENLKLIPANNMPKLQPLREADQGFWLSGLDGVIGRVWLDKIWEMLWGRWRAYENFCNKR
jgi:hypothetical protein